MTPYSSPKASLQIIRMIHFSLLGSTAVFGGVMLLLVTGFIGEGIPRNDALSFLIYVPLALLLITIPVSGLVYKKVLQSSLSKANDLAQKLEAFRSAHLVRMAMFEACGLMGAVVSFVTGTWYDLGVAGIVVFIFAANIPSVLMLEQDLGLSSTEKAQLAD